MKNRWLVVVLAASVALNAAAIGAFAYHRYSKQSRRALLRDLKGRSKGRLKELFKEREPQMDSLRRVYSDVRRELGELAFSKNPDSLKVDSLLDIIGATHREMSRQVLETTRAVESLHPAEGRKKFRRRLMKVWEGPDRRRHGRGGSRRGRRMPRPERLPEPPPDEGP